MKHKTFPLWELTPELKLLFDLAAGNPVSEIPEGISWERFVHMAEKNRVEPLLAPRLRKLPAASEEQLTACEAIQQTANRQILLSMKQCQVLAQLAAEFQRHSIRMLSMKGPLLAIELYGNPALRYSRDLDLLVDEKDFAAARQIMLDVGFAEEEDPVERTPKRQRLREARHEEMHGVFWHGDICVELHWRISLRWEATFEELWEQHRESQLLGATINQLGKLDDLGYLTCHAAAHGYSRLRWLMDLYVLFGRPDVDFPALYRSMLVRKTQSLLLETLLVLYRCPSFMMCPIDNKLFCLKRDGNQILLDYADELRKDWRRAQKLAATVWPCLHLEAGEWGISGKRYRSLLPDTGQRHGIGGFLISLVEPNPADFERFDFPDELFFLYYLVCPFYRLRRAVLPHAAEHE